MLPWISELGIPALNFGRSAIKTLRNVSTRPIKVPLPLGKVLHLSPRKSGEIADKAVDHPPLVKLIEAGDLELLGDADHGDHHGGPSGSIRDANRGSHPERTARNRGDR